MWQIIAQVANIRTAITPTGRVSSAQVPSVVSCSHRITRFDHQDGRLYRNRPLVKNIKSPKKALKVEIVTTMEMIRNLWIRKALIRPRPAPKIPAAIRPMAEFPPPNAAKNQTQRYCTPEAATAKEMSIPPTISTTKRPTAQITLTALLFIKLV